MLSSNRYKCVLVVGAEKLSSIMDWEDRTTCVFLVMERELHVLQMLATDHNLLALRVEQMAQTQIF